MDDALRRGIKAIEDAVTDPRRGLPDDVFQLVSRLTPLVNVDLLIQDSHSRTLLTWRDDTFGTGWHVPGGVIRFKETALDRVVACARDELGADVSADPLPVLVSEAFLDQPTRGHHIALLFRCRLAGPLDERRKAAADPPREGQWRWHDRCPPDLLAIQRHYARFM